GNLRKAQRQIGGGFSAREQILKEGTNMRCDRLVAASRRQNMLDEADHVCGSKATKKERAVAEAMIEEAVGEAQRVIDRSRTQTPLLDEIILIVSQQRHSRLRRFIQNVGHDSDTPDWWSTEDYAEWVSQDHAHSRAFFP